MKQQMNPESFQLGKGERCSYELCTQWQPRGGLTDVLTNVLKDVDHEEGRYQVVDALHVAASRVADGPDEKDPFKYLNKRNGVNTIGRSLPAVGGV